MANSSDEDFISDDDSIDLNPLWRDSPFLSDSSTEEDKEETTLNFENAVRPPIVLELTPMTASDSEQDNSTNTAETNTTSSGMGARHGLPGQLDVPLTPFSTPWRPAASSNLYGQQAFPISIQNLHPGSVLALAPITASASAQNNSTNTTETNTMSTGMRPHFGLPGQLNVSLPPLRRPRLPASSGEQALSNPARNVAPRRRQRNTVIAQLQATDTPAQPQDSKDEVEDKAPKKDPRFVLPGAIREREEREDAEIEEATNSTRALRSEFVSELLLSSVMNRVSRADIEKISDRFGTKNKKK